MSLRGLLLALMLACAGLAAPAAELVLRDLTVGVGLPPGKFSYTISDTNGDRSGDDGFDKVGGIYLGGMRSFARAGDASGLVLGARWAMETSRFSGGGLYSGFGPDLQVGWGVALSDRLALVPCALVGARRHAMSLEANGTIAPLTAAGFGWTCGGQLMLTYAIADRVVVALDGGWRTGRSSLSGDRSVDLDSKGFTAGLSFGWRFGATPERLE